MAALVFVGALVLSYVVLVVVMRRVQRHADHAVPQDLRRAGDDPNASPGPGTAADRAVGANSWMRPTW